MEMDVAIVSPSGDREQSRRRYTDYLNSVHARVILDAKAVLMQDLPNDRRLPYGGTSETNATIGFNDMGTALYRWRGVLCERPY